MSTRQIYEQMTDRQLYERMGGDLKATMGVEAKISPSKVDGDGLWFARYPGKPGEWGKNPRDAMINFLMKNDENPPEINAVTELEDEGFPLVNVEGDPRAWRFKNVFVGTKEEAAQCALNCLDYTDRSKGKQRKQEDTLSEIQEKLDKLCEDQDYLREQVRLIDFMVDRIGRFTIPDWNSFKRNL